MKKLHRFIEQTDKYNVKAVAVTLTSVGLAIFFLVCDLIFWHKVVNIELFIFFVVFAAGAVYSMIHNN